MIVTNYELRAMIKTKGNRQKSSKKKDQIYGEDHKPAKLATELVELAEEPTRLVKGGEYVVLAAQISQEEKTLGPLIKANLDTNFPGAKGFPSGKP